MMAAHKVLFLEILRATNLCLCGSHIKWRSGVGIDYGTEYYQGLINTHYFILSSLCIVFFTVFYRIKLMNTHAHTQVVRKAGPLWPE